MGIKQILADQQNRPDTMKIWKANLRIKDDGERRIVNEWFAQKVREEVQEPPTGYVVDTGKGRINA